jgi:4-hydroxy-tetrahydrodipicolinate synthase
LEIDAITRYFDESEIVNRKYRGDIMRRPWTGCGTALVTPFTRDGALDEAGVRRLARRQIDAGIHFLVPCGTTGESPTLSEAERVRVVELVADEAAGKVPILAGAGGYDTKEVVQAARRMQQAGATGILSVTPYYNKPTPEGLFQHYRTIGEAISLPIIVYNVPGRTGCNVDVPTLVRLSALPNIAGVKEASGNMTQICEVCRAVPEDFIVLSGDDALTLPVMAAGGHGIISVASNEVPKEMARMVELAERNDFAAARRIHLDLLPLMMVNFVESNPIPVKSAMAALGLLEEVYRLPMVPPRPASREKIVAVLESLKLAPASRALAR